MGTKVQSESYFPGYCSMRNLSEDSNGSTWPLYYGDKTSTNGQYYNGFLPKALVDGYSGYEKDAVKQKMLEHEAIFKSQVYELHRLYRIQRDLMDEIRRKELHTYHRPAEASLSSSPLKSLLPSEEFRKWHIPSFPSVNFMGVRPPVSSAEDTQSHLSSIVGKSAQAGIGTCQNEGNSKDCEILESRPTKVRRKMFDLQLPAEEYIDTEEVEQLGDKKVSEISCYPANKCCKTVADSGVKLFLGSSEKPGRQGDALISDACLGSRNGLADLNEPFQVEEANSSASLDILGKASCQRESRDEELSVLKPQFLGLPNGTLPKFNRGRDTETPNNLKIESNGNGREWMSYMLEAGNAKSNLTSGSQALQPEKFPIPSQPLQVTFNKAPEPQAFLPTDQSKEELMRKRTISALKFSERSHNLCQYNHREPVMISNITNPCQFVPSSDLAKSCSHSALSWEKPITSFSQQSMSVQTYPCFNLSSTLSSSQSSAQSPGIFGEKGHITGNSRSNTGFGSEVPNRNGFYHGSSSGSKVHFTSTGFDNLNCSNDSNVPIEQINHTSTQYFKSSNHMDVNSANHLKWDVMLSHSSSNRAVPQKGLETINGERKHDGHPEVLPWLGANYNKNEAAYARNDLHMVDLSFSQAASNQLSDKSETEKGIGKSFAQIITSASCARDVGSKGIDIIDCSTTKMIFGFPILERPDDSKNESPLLKSTSASASLCAFKGEDIDGKEKIGLIDINYPCDPEVSDPFKDIDTEVMEKRGDKEVASLRNYIDLNSCISEDEDLLSPSVSFSAVRTAKAIDLEASVAPESEEDSLFGEASQEMLHQMTVQSSQLKAECLQDEIITIAAEAIVAISSSACCNQVKNDTCSPLEEASMDPLYWFVEVVSSCADDLERGKRGDDNEDSSPNGIDYFESMTLKLTEVNIEEYLSEFPVPQNSEVEEAGNKLLTNRPRKGQARRGRQRRDFQRDILPGLTSLSRHEVTEDLQTFGGIMRATGHPWHSGLARRTAARNGYGRGRRRSVVIAATALVASPVCSPVIQQLNNIEVGLEDRSLTGWGKTTRRPRRQRCSAGNPPSLPLT